MNPQETFVTRLRRQRLRARVSIEQIADSLRIKPEIIAAFEANDLSEWPKGLYSRAWIRAYALAVDLDPVDGGRVLPSVSAGRSRRAEHDSGDSRRSSRLRSIRDEFGHPEDGVLRPKPSRAEGRVACLRHAARPRVVDAADRSEFRARRAPRTP